MLRISLINMPFAAVHLPSIALTQLKALTEEEHRGRVSIRVHYFNQELARYIGLEQYRFISESLEANMRGFGDWFFRQSAFPELADNTEAYFDRFFPARDPEFEIRRKLLLGKRRNLDGFLSRLIAENRLEADHMVGFTTMFCQNAASFALARLLKKRNPQIATVIGGANCEGPMGIELARRIRALDYVFSGPALKSFPRFVALQLNNASQPASRIRGVFSKLDAEAQRSSEIGEELSIERTIDLDYQPFVKTLKRNFPAGQVKPTLLFETSRGCWWGERAHCTFCGLNGSSMNYRAMPADKALRQFDSLFQQAPRCRSFESVDNIMPRNYLSEVFPRLRPPAEISIFYEVKADLKDNELATMARARVTEVQPGIEALSSSTLKLMKKGATAFQNIIFLKNCLLHGVRPGWNLLMGFPGEKEEVYRKYLEDLPLLVHLPPPSGAYPVRFDRFSPYFTQAREYGLDLHASDFYAYVYPFDEASLERMAYYFNDREYSAEYLKTLAQWGDAVKEKTDAWVNRWRNGARPELHFDSADPRRIFDSRGPGPREHLLGAKNLRLLRLLERPLRLQSLANAAGQTEPEVGIALESLQEKDLLFEERGRFLSLVMARRIAQPFQSS